MVGVGVVAKRRIQVGGGADVMTLTIVRTGGALTAPGAPLPDPADPANPVEAPPIISDPKPITTPPIVIIDPPDDGD